MILYGSNLGTRIRMWTTNLPALFAGGGFRHGQHLAFDRERNYPLPNLFVSVLQRLGIEQDRFGDVNGDNAGPRSRRVATSPLNCSRAGHPKVCRAVGTLKNPERDRVFTLCSLQETNGAQINLALPVVPV